jgi:hypothetical protein
MRQLLAQRDLEVVMTSLSPLLPLVGRKGCEEGSKVLAGLLGEALEAQEAASKRTDDLKQLQPKGLMELFTPEKGRAAVVKGNAQGAKNNGQRERLQEEEELQASPRKAQTPKKKKRSRKVSEKAAALDSDVEEDEEVKKPKKQGNNGVKKKMKKSVKNGGGGWNGEEYPRIFQVVKCEDGADGLRVEVLAKKQGRGQWQKVLFSLDSNQLSSIDYLPEKAKNVVVVSFHKAVAGLYGQHWPNSLRVALARTTWAKGILPAAAGGNGDDNVALDNPIPNANLFDVE